MYLPRTLEKYFLSSAGQFPVMLLTGARQVGKTTFLRHIAASDRSYVTLDDPLILSLAKSDPALFMQRFKPPILIDEIQYAPELLPYIKMICDERKDANLFWLTGSQQFHLMKGVSESLAGRVGVVQLTGLSRQEILGKGSSVRPFLPTEEAERSDSAVADFSLETLYEMIWFGSFPGVVVNMGADRNLFYSSYLQTYLQRDIRDLARVGDEMAFLRFIRATAARTGQMLNMADLARDADVVFNTAKSWLSILQSSGIVYLLEPYHSNLTKRLIKTPKLYFLDTGLAAYLTEWSSPETLEAGAMSGSILETWILNELLKSYWHCGLRAPFYYYRDKEKKEIDLLIVQDGTIWPLEFKKSASPRKEDVRHFAALGNLNTPIGKGGVICLVRQSLPLTENAFSIPIATI